MHRDRRSLPVVGRGPWAAARSPAAGTFWMVTWQPVSKPPLSLTLLLYFLGVYRAETIQAKVGNVHVRAFQLLRYLPRDRREERRAGSRGPPHSWEPRLRAPGLGLMFMQPW